MTSWNRIVWLYVHMYSWSNIDSMPTCIVCIIFDISSTRMENKDDFIFSSARDLNQTLVGCLLICRWGSLHVWEINYGDGLSIYFHCFSWKCPSLPINMSLSLMSYICTLHIHVFITNANMHLLLTIKLSLDSATTMLKFRVFNTGVISESAMFEKNVHFCSKMKSWVSVFMSECQMCGTDSWDKMISWSNIVLHSASMSRCLSCKVFDILIWGWKIKMILF